MYNKYLEKALKYMYTDNANFIASKVKNIHDKLPHLVHADYLEENDKPHTAKFIRDVTEGHHDDPENNEISLISHEHGGNSLLDPKESYLEAHLLSNGDFKGTHKLVYLWNEGTHDKHDHTIRYKKLLPVDQAEKVHQQLKEELDN